MMGRRVRGSQELLVLSLVHFSRFQGQNHDACPALRNLGAERTKRLNTNERRTHMSVAGGFLQGSREKYYWQR